MLSSNEEVFEQETAVYNEGLKAAGYQQMIKYIPPRGQYLCFIHVHLHP